MNEHPNNPKTFKPSYGNHTSLADSRGEKGREEGERGRGERKGREEKEFVYSEMAERHAKGICFPKEGRCGESCGVRPSFAFWGCLLASN